MVAKSAALMGLLTLVAPSIAVAVPKAARDTCAKSVKIEPGDNCWTVSVANNIGLLDIFSYNPNISEDCNDLFIGQTLCVAIDDEGKSPGTGQCGKTVTVKPGDTCSAIANENGIPLAVLNTMNPWINSGCRNMKPGEDICLAEAHLDEPVERATTNEPFHPIAYPGSCKKPYVVKGGDSCWAIANAHFITVDQLRSWNNLDAACSLYAGDTICIQK